jgi:hypothetical protein
MCGRLLEDALTTLRCPRLFQFLLLRLCCHQGPMHLHIYQKFIDTVYSRRSRSKVGRGHFIVAAS